MSACLTSEFLTDWKRNDRPLKRAAITEIEQKGSFMSESNAIVAIIPVRVKFIPLSQGKFAMVDAEDYGWLSQFTWHAQKSGRKFYARTWQRINGKNKAVGMHNAILGVKGIDHVDNDGLNNTRRNLRPCTNSQNMCNRGKDIVNVSGFKGVTKSSDCNRWQAIITINKKTKYIGMFKTPEEAARAYDAEAIKMHGEFVRTNQSLGLLERKLCC